MSGRLLDPSERREPPDADFLDDELGREAGCRETFGCDADCLDEEFGRDADCLDEELGRDAGCLDDEPGREAVGLDDEPELALG